METRHETLAPRFSWLGEEGAGCRLNPRRTHSEDRPAPGLCVGWRRSSSGGLNKRAGGEGCSGGTEGDRLASGPPKQCCASGDAAESSVGGGKVSQPGSGTPALGYTAIPLEGAWPGRASGGGEGGRPGARGA